jgi:hypothetical protein
MADEKRAFDDMLAEIAEDDSSEDERPRPSYNRSKFGDQDSKPLGAGSKNVSKKCMIIFSYQFFLLFYYYCPSF